MTSPITVAMLRRASRSHFSRPRGTMSHSSSFALVPRGVAEVACATGDLLQGCFQRPAEGWVVVTRRRWRRRDFIVPGGARRSVGEGSLVNVVTLRWERRLIDYRRRCKEILRCSCHDELLALMYCERAAGAAGPRRKKKGQPRRR